MKLHPSVRYAPSSDHPGWWTWDLAGPERFNHVIQPLLVRRGEPGIGWCRMFPQERHANLGDVVHGATLMTFIDCALFAGGTMTGAEIGPAVTLDCAVHFLDAASIGPALDAEVELLRATGRLVFLRGRVLQEEKLIASFTGTLRKLHAPT